MPILPDLAYRAGRHGYQTPLMTKLIKDQLASLASLASHQPLPLHNLITIRQIVRTK